MLSESKIKFVAFKKVEIDVGVWCSSPIEPNLFYISLRHIQFILILIFWMMLSEL